LVLPDLLVRPVPYDGPVLRGDQRLPVRELVHRLVRDLHHVPRVVVAAVPGNDSKSRTLGTADTSAERTTGRASSRPVTLFGLGWALDLPRQATADRSREMAQGGSALDRTTQPSGEVTDGITDLYRTKFAPERNVTVPLEQHFGLTQTFDINAIMNPYHAVKVRISRRTVPAGWCVGPVPGERSSAHYVRRNRGAAMNFPHLLLPLSQLRRLLVVLIALSMLAGMTVPSVHAQDYSGWYGPFEDGCYYWWDGFQWTGDVDCNGDGSADSVQTTYAPGWYDVYGDGCLYWFDGTQYSGDVDCNGDGYPDSAETAAYSPGWYDVYGDGCLYWWDGAQYTGEADCDGDGYADTAAAASYSPGWYDLYGDGCLYWFDGTQYTGHVDCDGDGNADTGQSTSYSPGWYDAHGDGCLYWWDGVQYTGEVDCDGDGYADLASIAPAGWYGPYDDGCYYWWDESQWTGDQSCPVDDADASVLQVPTYAAGWYDLYGDGCLYWWDSYQYTGDVDCTGDGMADVAEAYPAGWYNVYGDGCLYWWDGAQYTGYSSCGDAQAREQLIATLNLAIALASQQGQAVPEPAPGCTDCFVMEMNSAVPAVLAGGYTGNGVGDLLIYTHRNLTNVQNRNLGAYAGGGGSAGADPNDIYLNQQILSQSRVLTGHTTVDGTNRCLFQAYNPTGTRSGGC
jgi:hypothetical protein